MKRLLFLLPVAASVQSSGGRVVSVHEASRIPTLLRGWLPRPWRLLSSAHKFGELAGYENLKRVLAQSTRVVAPVTPAGGAPRRFLPRFRNPSVRWYQDWNVF